MNTHTISKTHTHRFNNYHSTTHRTTMYATNPTRRHNLEEMLHPNSTDIPVVACV